MPGEFIDGLDLRGSALRLEAELYLCNRAASFGLAPLHPKMGELIDLSFRRLQHLSAKLGEILVGVRKDAEGSTQASDVGSPDRLAAMDPQCPEFIQLERVARSEA